MAQGKVQQPTQSRAKKAGRTAARAEPRSVADWQQECERLRAELAAAREEVATLRMRQQQALKRIERALASLDGLSGTEH